MNRFASFLERLPESRPFFFGLVAFLLLIFTTANMPWHLDNYDQAKQAYVALEISKSGEIWFQHTPQDRSASKPPLMGWISAALHAAGMPWDLAWRLPAFACALALLALLIREGRTALGQAGATLAAAAFGLNLLTPRLATLVRTDMMLGFFIFLLGWLIYRKLRAGAPWTIGEQWAVFACMMAALFTKGPVLYAFLLPGMVAFVFLARNAETRRLVWSGWWTWLIPLGFFLIWLVVGLKTHPAFYNDVVDREFLSRFQNGARDDERSQPLWFYFPHLLQKFAPWSLLLLALVFCFPQVRKGLRDRPPLLWLVLWATGGLILMTFIPAKRVDRIFPVVPPFCLLVVEWCTMLWKDRRIRVAAGSAILAGLLFAGSYFLALIPLSYRDHTTALVDFANRAREMAAARGVSLVTLPRTRDEGMLLYFDLLDFAGKSDVMNAWRSGKPVAIVLSDRSTEVFKKDAGPVVPALDSGALKDKNENRYYLFLRN